MTSGDKVAVTDGVVSDSEFEDPVKEQAAVARAAAIEAKHELVEVAGQVRLIGRTLVGAEQPPLGQ